MDIKKYQRIWFLGFVLFYILPVVFKNLLFLPLEGLMLIFFAMTGIMFMVLSNRTLGRIMDYLKNNYPQKWKELNTYPIFGEGFVNNFRVYMFAKSKELDHDPKIIELKNEFNALKRFLCFALLSCCLFFPVIYYALELLIK